MHGKGLVAFGRYGVRLNFISLLADESLEDKDIYKTNCLTRTAKAIRGLEHPVSLRQLVALCYLTAIQVVGDRLQFFPVLGMADDDEWKFILTPFTNLLSEVSNSSIKHK